MSNLINLINIRNSPQCSHVAAMRCRGLYYRFEYEYEIEHENDFFNSSFQASHYHNTLSQHIHISPHELLSLPKTNMKNKGSGNVLVLVVQSKIYI